MKELLITIAIGIILLGVIIVCFAATAADYDPAWDEWDRTENGGDKHDH